MKSAPDSHVDNFRLIRFWNCCRKTCKGLRTAGTTIRAIPGDAPVGFHCRLNCRNCDWSKEQRLREPPRLEFFLQKTRAVPGRKTKAPSNRLKRCLSTVWAPMKFQRGIYGVCMCIYIYNKVCIYIYIYKVYIYMCVWCVYIYMVYVYIYKVYTYIYIYIFTTP